MTRARAVRAVVVLALIASVLYFGWRGVWRGLMDSGDLTYAYSAVQAWLVGKNPYDAVVLGIIVLAGGGPIVPMAIGHGVYFPTSLPIFLPLAFVSWDVAKVLWLVVDVVAALFIALGLTRWLGWRPSSTRALAMMAYILALGPMHATIMSGQTGVVATAFIVGAMLLERSERPAGGGIAYALATAAKVQVGLPFVAYIAWRRRWRVLVAAGVVLGALTVVSVVRMQIAGVPWLDSWTSNLAWLTGPLGNGDPGPENPDRFSLINLAYPLRTFLPEREASIVTLLLVGAAAAAMVWLIRGRRPRQELLALSVVGVLGLLVTYHRYYDAVVLAIPVAWAFAQLGTRRWRYGVAVLGLGSVFVVPILGALLQAEPSLPESLTGSVLWSTVILPHHAWALVGMVVALLLAAARYRDVDEPAIDEPAIEPSPPESLVALT